MESPVSDSQRRKWMIVDVVMEHERTGDHRGDQEMNSIPTILSDKAEVVEVYSKVVAAVGLAVTEVVTEVVTEAEIEVASVVTEEALVEENEVVREEVLAEEEVEVAALEDRAVVGSVDAIAVTAVVVATGAGSVVDRLAAAVAQTPLIRWVSEEGEEKQKRSRMTLTIGHPMYKSDYHTYGQRAD